MSDGMTLRMAETADFERIWEIFHAVVARGDTYAYDPATTREEARALWMNPEARTYVAVVNRQVVGTFWIRRNQPGLGSHVANAAFMVDPAGFSRGVGRRMGEHALAEARRLGFDAMQFNFVVSTNERAVALWNSLGFSILATLPRAFRHATLGYVDALVMHRFLR